MKFEYSQAEFKMFAALGLHQNVVERLAAPEIYRLACIETFLFPANKPSIAIDALIKLATIILYPHKVNYPIKYKRLTPEFDALINL